MLAPIAKQFRQLREVNISSKCFRHTQGVVIESVSCELNAIRKAVVQVPEKRSRIRPRTLADTKRGNQLTLRINGNVNPLISNFRRVDVAKMTALFLHEAPNLINLQIPGTQFAHSRIHQALTAMPRQNEQPHDGIAIEARQPFCAANRAALNKAVNRPRCCIGIRQHRVTRKFRVRPHSTLALQFLQIHLLRTRLPK